MERTDSRAHVRPDSQLMLATGEIVTGTFFGASATFVSSDRDVSYRVWSEHPDGVFRVRNAAYRGAGLAALIAADCMWWSHAPSCSMDVVVTPYGVMCPLEECRVHTDDWRVIADLCAADAAKQLAATTEPVRRGVWAWLGSRWRALLTGPRLIA